MGNKEELCEQGWYISTDGYSLITENGNIKDKRTTLSNALNTDIRDFGNPILSNIVKENSTGKVILQIQKIRNISAPKSKEESQAAPRMLKLTLTDGHTSCQAIEITNISSISRTHTPPGSKLLINGARICSSCILLHPNCCTLLGGRVPALCEKWELVKNISEHVRTSGTDGAPPWVNFGEKIISCVSNEPFKALADKTTKETCNEFDVHRQDAIAVASGAVKKVFGGGVKTMQVSDNQQNYRKYNSTRENQNNQESKSFKGRRDNKEKLVEKPQKPTEKMSLFDFLEDKLLVNETPDVKTNSKSTGDNNFSKEEFYMAASQQKYVPRNDYKQNSPRIQQKNNRSMTRPPVNTFMVTNNSGFNKTNNSHSFESTSRNSTNSAVGNPATLHSTPAVNPVEVVSRNFGNMSIDSQFASRSLRQHLNLGNNRNEFVKSKVNSSSGVWNWKVGDLCMAKYWEDGKYYNATVINLTERTCVVQFNGYGNVEEVLKVDCIPIGDGPESHPKSNVNNYNKGSMGNRNNRRTFSNNRSYNKAV